ncbi:MAG: nitroreductase [Oscillospiraceae bacterium]|jgi:nitroreductase|nr:nitroreductase [Oscillospiraceae bacterium]
MDVIDAIRNRHSVRAFLPEPVDRETLNAVFETAARSPSWANSQPWEVFAATGGALERIREGYRSRYDSKSPTAPETPPPKVWTEAAKKRQQQLYPDMLRDCGESVEQFGTLNQSLFGAPAVVYICMDKTLSEWSLYDIGAYSQSLMLAALGKGLGAIQAITLTMFPDIVRRELSIPENLKITIGIAIGYPDKGNKINSFVSARSPLEETVHIFE